MKLVIDRSAANDDGGGSFVAVDPTPAANTIVNVTTTIKAISGATNATPIVITTTTAHGLNTGHSVKIAAVGGNTNANGSWNITKIDATSFSLDGSFGNANYTSGGAATYGSITCADAHGLIVAGGTIVIRGVTGSTGVNGTWFPVGYDDITGELFTVPCDTESAYIDGGIIGNGGTTIPSSDGTTLYRRLHEGAPYNARWWGAQGDGATDDTAAIHGCIRAGQAHKRDVFIPKGTYLINREVYLHSQGNRIAGEGQVIGAASNVSRTVLKCTRAGMRSFISLAHTDQDIRDLFLECDDKASYGLHFQTAGQSKLENVQVANAVYDGFHVASVDDGGSATNNNFLALVECSAFYCGTVYCTADFQSAVYGSGVKQVTVAGTVSVNVLDDTVTGSGTSFLATGARTGDFIRIGDPTSPQTVEILSVDSNTQITLQPQCLPTDTFIGAEYAICVGDGYHEERGNDNDRARIIGGCWRSIGGCGMRFNGLYGPHVINSQFDTICAYGIALSDGSALSTMLTCSIANTYHEGAAAGTAGCIYVSKCLGFSILSPMWDGTGNTLVLNDQTFNTTGFYSDSSGTKYIQGKLFHVEQNATEEYVPAYSALGCGLNRMHQSKQVSTDDEPAIFCFIPIKPVDHFGVIDLNIVAAYKGGAGGGGSRKMSIPYTYLDEILTIAAGDDLTPPGQVNPFIPDPTFELVTVGGVLGIHTLIYGNTTGVDTGITYYDGTVQITMTSLATSTFTPATMDLNGWWRTDFSASPWIGTGSTGPSAGYNLSTATNAPSVGSALNVHNTADFDGTNDHIDDIAESLDDFVDAGEGSIAILFRADTAAADAGSGTPQNNEAIFADAGPSLIIGMTASGVRAGYYDGAWNSILTTCSTSAWHLVQMRWDGENIDLRIDSGDWTSVPAGNISDLTNGIFLGKNYNATAFFDGRIAECMLTDVRLNDVAFDRIKAYCNTRYALTL